MRQIAGAVGIRAASIYEHFASKEAILAAIATTGHDAFLATLESAVAAAGDEPVDQIRAAVQTMVDQLCRYPHLSMTINKRDALPAPGHAQRPIEARDQVSLLLALAVHRGIEQGAFAERNLVVLVASIGSMCIRTPYWFCVPTAVYGVDDPAGEYADLVVAMLTAGA